jgi:GAF domain-containing protein
MENVRAGTDQQARDAAEDFGDLARAVLSAGDEKDTLAAVIELAVGTIEGCDHAGIFLLEGNAVTTPAGSGPVVTELDIVQRDTGEGPCLEAIRDGATMYSWDLNDDDRWPSFAREATSRGVRGVFAVPLAANGIRGAVNLYAEFPHPFGVVDRARAQLLAGLSGMALAVARLNQAEERRKAAVQAALSTREMIGQAQGILMERERITGDQAFDILRRASQHLNRKLRDVAQTLVDTGETPDTGSSAPSS